MVTKTELIKDITHTAWKTLGIAKRGEIAKEYAKIVMRSSYSEEKKADLLSAISRIGWELNKLAAAGYGYNTGNDAHYDRDSAGKLNTKNKTACWVYS
jgi:hypothetical protein